MNLTIVNLFKLIEPVASLTGSYLYALIVLRRWVLSPTHPWYNKLLHNLLTLLLEKSPGNESVTSVYRSPAPALDAPKTAGILLIPTLALLRYGRSVQQLSIQSIMGSYKPLIPGFCVIGNGNHRAFLSSVLPSCKQRRSFY